MAGGGRSGAGTGPSGTSRPHVNVHRVTVTTAACSAGQVQKSSIVNVRFGQWRVVWATLRDCVFFGGPTSECPLLVSSLAWEVTRDPDQNRSVYLELLRISGSSEPVN
jgi:hypothetical protein